MSDFTFKDLGEHDITDWVSLIQGESEDTWNMYNMRNQPGGNHADTKFIPIYWGKYLNSKEVPLENGQDVIRFDMSLSDNYKTLLNKFVSGISNIYGDCEIIKAIIIKLKPGGVIPPHIDDMGLLKDSHRVHLPIITNAGVVMTCGDDNLSPPQPGHAFEINNVLEHSVKNTGDTWRVHLVVDFLDVKGMQINVTDAKVSSQSEYKETLRKYLEERLKE